MNFMRLLFFSLSTTALALPPANDNRASGQVLSSSSSVNVAGTLSEATHELGEPDLSPFGESFGEPTVWYRWTAPAGSEWLRVELGGFNLPSVLTIYPSGSNLKLESLRSEGSVVLYVPVTGGSTYEIRPSVWLEDLQFSVPFPGVPDLDFTLELDAIGAPSTVDDYIFRARARISAGTAADISGALADLSAALGIDSDNEEALFLRGLTRLLNLENEPEFDQLLTDLGISTTGSLIEGTLQIPEDLDGLPVFASGASFGDVVTWLTDQFLPRLSDARQDLSAITDEAFLTQLSGAETGSEGVLIDRGDVLALIATTHGLEMFFNLIFTYDLAVSLESLVELERNGQLDAETTMAMFQNLLDFAATDRRADFATELVAMRDSYAAASTRILARPSQDGFLTRSLAQDPSRDAEVRQQLDFGVNSLSGEVDWNGTRVDLSRLLVTPQSLRDWLPQLSGDKFIPGTLPDPTFDGVFPGAGAAASETLFYQLGLLAGLADYASFYAPYLDFLGLPSGPFDDADGDGITNFDESLFLTDPTVPDVVFQSLEREEVAPTQTELTFTFIRPIDAAAGNWPLVVAVSDDLSTWDRTEAKVQEIEVVDNEDGFSETVTYQLTGVDPGQTNNRYFRIEAVYRANP